MGSYVYNNLYLTCSGSNHRLFSSSIRSSFVRCSSSDLQVSKKQVLDQVDKELTNGNDRAALTLVKDLQGKPGGLRCFGAARQVRHYVNMNKLPCYTHYVHCAGASKAIHFG